MAPPTINDRCASSQSSKERNVYDDDEQDCNSSQTKQEESSQEGYESEYGDSACSVTSGVDCYLHEGTAPYVDRQAVNLPILQADESAITTWTDEKHSSYLNSMEANFVQKMYDKEYCSLDVCGHSSHSSVTLDQECVESQPSCLNMRKPYEERVAGLLTFRAPARPLPLVRSMWASPWIQHFKSQKQNAPSKIVSSKNAEFQGEGVSTKEVVNPTSVTHNSSSFNEVSPQSSHDSAHRKRGAQYAATNSRGYTLPSLSKTAGEYKKQKCQHSTLSHMDILMEEQYNSEQHTNLGTNISIEDGKEESNKHLAKHCEHSEAIKFCDKLVSEEIKAMKEKQDLVGISLQKLDQVVPSFQDVEGEAACGKSILPDPDDPEEGVLCTHLTEPGDVTTRSCSKTWTWGIEGPRYHLIGKKATHSEV